MAKKKTTPTPSAPVDRVHQFEAKHVVQLDRTGRAVQFHWSVTPHLSGEVEIMTPDGLGRYSRVLRSTAVALGNALIKSAHAACELERKVNG